MNGAEALAIAGAGAMGALARLGVMSLLPGPAGTAAVNLSGSLLLGLAMGHWAGPAEPSVLAARLLVLAVAWCGAYTTWSTFVVDVVRLGRAGRCRAAAFHTALVIGVCPAVAWGGNLAAEWLIASLG